MKKLVFFLILSCITITPPKSEAQGSNGVEGRFGLGLYASNYLGGVSLKHYASTDLAYRLSLSYSSSYTFVGVDYLINNPLYLQNNAGKPSWYYGLGAIAGFFGDKASLGVKVPAGATYIFQDAPIELFVEPSISLNIIPSTTAYFGITFGGHFYF